MYNLLNNSSTIVERTHVAVQLTTKESAETPYSQELEIEKNLYGLEHMFSQTNVFSITIWTLFCSQHTQNMCSSLIK